MEYITALKNRFTSIIYKNTCSENKAGTNLLSILDAKQTFYTVCFVLLCFVDLLRSTTPEFVSNCSNLCIGVIIAAISLTAFSLKECFSVSSLIWTICSIFLLKNYLAPYKLDGVFFLFAVNYWLIGLVFLRIICHVVYKRKILHVRFYLFIPWVFMMISLIRSDNDSYWPFWFLFLFGAFFLTPFSKEDSERLYEGITSGIIIGFFMIQGFCLFFRAYDELRYTGLYNNSNVAAIFYVIAHAAMLGKWLQLNKKGASLPKKLLPILGIAFTIALCAFCSCRTGLFAMALNTVLAIFLKFFTDSNFRFAKTGARVLVVPVCTVLLLPVSFYLVRFVPAQVKNPLLIYENNEQSKIIEEVDIDDPRYITYEQMKEEDIDRVWEAIDSIKKEKEKDNNVFDKLKELLPQKVIHNPFSLTMAMSKVHAADINTLVASANTSSAKGSSSAYSASKQDENQIVYGSGKSKKDPILSKSVEGSFNTRLEIYKYFFRNLNEKGHKNSEIGFWLTQNTFYEHAHNVNLQFLFLYGKKATIFMMGFFLIVMLFYFLGGMNPFSPSTGCAISLFFLVAFWVFGLLELDYYLGQISFTMLFVSIRFLFESKPDCIVWRWIMKRIANE